VALHEGLMTARSRTAPAPGLTRGPTPGLTRGYAVPTHRGWPRARPLAL